MAEYRVTWTIELDADSPAEAALKALEIHRDPESIATVFDVQDEEGTSINIDLGEMTCRHCDESIAPDDGGAIWYHSDTMSAWCEGDDEEIHYSSDTTAEPKEV